ncbi:MAG: DUF1491 family protein [Aestuariivita sp.]|nr:DUF1491 family protein [Aestuariivita sp.]
MTRLTSKFWVQAYLARLQLADIPGYVVVHGDDSAGEVYIKVNNLNGEAQLMHRSYDLHRAQRSWMELLGGSEAKIDAMIDRQRSIDPDLWVIEIEDSSGRHFLHDEGLE